MATAARRRLPRSVVVLGIVSLLNDASSEMIYPLMPFFLREHLKASVAFVGLVEGIAETTASLLKLFSGWLSDRLGRHKTLTFLGYALAGLTRPLMAVVTAAWQVLALRFVDRIGKGIRTAPRDALLANACDEATRGFAFGFHRAMDNFGAVIGPLLASAVLLIAPGNYRLAFVLAAVPALLSLGVLWWGVSEETQPLPTVSSALSLRQIGSGVRELPSAFRWYLASVLLFTLSNSSDAFLLLRAKGCGVAGKMIPLLWTWLHIVKSGTTTHGGLLSDRIGRLNAIRLGWLVYAGVYASFAFLQSPWQVWLAFTVYGLYFGLTEGAERALVADLVPAERRGVGYGAFHFVVGAGMLPASVLFGVLWDVWGVREAFLFGAVLALAATVLLSGVAKATTH
ncbi:MAG: hypothetical protein LKKZDAJK_000597 [Candidatus Fervidibacter sp.]